MKSRVAQYNSWHAGTGSRTTYITTAFVLASEHPGLETKILCSTHCCTVKYTEVQPLVEGVLTGESAPDRWASLWEWTHGHTVTPLEGRSLKGSYVGGLLYCVKFQVYYFSFDVCMHCGMITIISLGTICPHTVITVLYGPYSLCCVLHLHWVACFITGGLYFLTTTTYFTYLATVVYSLYILVCFHFVCLFFRFHV